MSPRTPLHRLPWYPSDWLGSGLRAELALARDHVTRLVYRELLDVLWVKGGLCAPSAVAGACMVSPEEAAASVEKLLASGRIQRDEAGNLFNERILEALRAEADYRANQAGYARRRWDRVGTHSRPIANPLPSLSPPPPPPPPSPTQEQELPRAPKRARAEVPAHAKALAASLKAHLETSKATGGPDRGAQIPASTEPWAREIARIQAPTEEIAHAIDWLFSPANTGEHRFVVQSGGALRDKYGRVVAAMNRSTPTQRSRDAGVAAARRTDETLDQLRADQQRTYDQLHAEGVIETPTKEAFEAARASGKLVEAMRKLRGTPSAPESEESDGL